MTARSRFRMAVARVVGSGLLMAGAGVNAADGELRVTAPIVAVDPIHAAPAEPALDCRVSRPTPGSHLLDLLAWDLRAGCPRHRTVTGYRVSYRWDGRTYQRIMDRPPAGDSIALVVKVR